MSRNPRIEAILEAWYELETCAPNRKAERSKRFHDLLDLAIADAAIKGVSRNELKELLGDAYHDFKRTRRAEERSRLARLR